MIYNFNDFLFEKSSLTQYGVPRSVMQSIQEDFALSPDVEWEKITKKGDLMEELKKGEKNLYIMISVKNIFIFGSNPSIKGTEYFIDKYLYEDDGWSGDYIKQERDYKSITQLSYYIETKANIYKLIGEFTLKNQSERKLDKYQQNYIEFNEKFKNDFIKNFDKILKRITNKNFKSAKDKINTKAKQVAYQNNIIIKNLENPLAGGNGLNILDEWLYKFEDDYADYFGERLDVQEMSEYFTREKVLTMFMYYIYTDGKKWTT